MTLTRTHLASLVLILFTVACGSSGGTDGGTTGTTDGGTSGQVDGGTIGRTDGGTSSGADAGMVKLSCVGINNCLQSCTTQACEQGCVSAGTPTAQSDFDAVQQCFVMACPQTDGGPCAMTTSQTCSTCVDGTQADGGQCVGQVSTCEMDMSGSSSGSGSTGGTGMQSTKCSQILQCLQGCSGTDQTCANNCVNNATSSAQSLFQALDQCIMTACPQTDAGVCSMGNSSTCQACINGSVKSGGSCNSQFTACENG